MADISMKRKHDLEADEVRERIEKVADKIADRIGGSWDWDGDEAICEAKGAKARVGYDEKEVSMDVSLPRLLRPMRGKLESKIAEYFDRYFT
ncbi:MAG: polyhydroxyalkanoic acid system family protein [Myxococcota bacterium]